MKPRRRARSGDNTDPPRMDDIHLILSASSRAVTVDRRPRAAFKKVDGGKHSRPTTYQKLVASIFGEPGSPSMICVLRTTSKFFLSPVQTFPQQPRPAQRHAANDAGPAPLVRRPARAVLWQIHRSPASPNHRRSWRGETVEYMRPTAG